MEKPRPTDLAEAAGISVSYASMLLNGDRVAPQRLAVDVYRATGWKFDTIAGASEEEIDLLDRMLPARAKQAAA